jgi:hypothetical protein
MEFDIPNQERSGDILPVESLMIDNDAEKPRISTGETIHIVI